jgi:hypothetical protein
MTRNIKKIAHDLLPLSEAITELSLIISQLLNTIKPHAKFDDVQSATYFDNCTEASLKLTTSAELIRTYIQKVNDEADKEGLSKD